MRETPQNRRLFDVANDPRSKRPFNTKRKAEYTAKPTPAEEPLN